MKTPKNNLDLIWLKLEQEAGQVIVRQAIVIPSGIEVFLAWNGITEVRMLQIAVGQSVASSQYIRQFRGVGMQLLNEGEKSYFHLFLLDRSLEDIFSLFAADLLEHMGHISELENVLTAIHQRINFWRQLFARASGELLSPEAQRGLYGELYLLLRWLQAGSLTSRVITAWQGSAGSAQDFQYNRQAAEIKTSKAQKSQVRISNENQLDYTLCAELYLVHLNVYETPGDQNTLLKLISQIRMKLLSNPVTKDEFEHKLRLAGIHAGQELEYDRINYQVRSLSVYHVREGFPVINRGMLPSGALHHVSYELDLAACESFLTDEEQLMNMLR